MAKINKLVEEYFTKKNLSENSQRLYQLELERFFAWVDTKNYDPNKLNALVMDEYLMNLQHDPDDTQSPFHIRRKKALSDRSIEQSRRRLNAFFEWAARNDYIPKNPFWVLSNRLTPKSFGVSTAIKTPEISLNLKKLLNARHLDVSNENLLRVATIAHLAFWTGASREEISQLTVSNFNFSDSLSSIELPVNNQGISVKVTLPDHSAKIIRDYLTIRNSNYLLLEKDQPLVRSIKTGKFMSGWSIRHILRKWQESPQKSASKESILGPRQLRQSFQGLAIRKEVPDRIISMHFRVNQLITSSEKIKKDAILSLYQAVSQAIFV